LRPTPRAKFLGNFYIEMVFFFLTVVNNIRIEPIDSDRRNLARSKFPIVF